ncbi:RNA-directed DNA polymerase, eukaryota, reverse transcriptase zinc-binding domain protein [Tanacetum coccineum]
MFDIEDSKAPGPDGFTVRFYKSAWSIVGKEVCKPIQEFFQTGKLIEEVNVTLISLVPKIQTPDKVSDFEPIACCNVLYKCISKIMTNRLKKVIGKLVNENKSAFIVGRQITDNILLSQELFRGYNRRQKIKKVSFKIDLQKAYDTINWKFLRISLEQFGFHNRMVEWIMTCVTTTKFSISINEERVGYFKESRGLRQGDPKTPYLFTLIMKVFKLIMKKNIDEAENFKYHQGLKANIQKSIVFFGGLSIVKQNSILKIVPFSVGKHHVRYLGVTLITKNISTVNCKPLVEKVSSKVKDWRNKALSYSRRLQLIALCQGELTKGKANVSWNNICKPKDQGSLGLKNLFVWNEVLLVKHLWNVAAKKDTLWVRWINVERLKGRSVWEVSADSNSSMGRKNLLKLREKVRQHVLCKVGNGNTINAWYDKWCSIGPLCDLVSSREIYDAILSNDSKVAELILNGLVYLMGSNHMDRLSNMPDEVLSEILSLMPTKFAVRTSILSKRWRYNWTLVTSIDIDVLPFHGLLNCCAFVDHVLDRCKTTEIKLFRLHFSNLWLQESRTTKWVDEAVRLNVRDLEIQSVMLELPLSLFTCKTLTKLTIENLNSAKDLEWQTPFNLPCVKTLDIGVYDNPSLTAFRLIRGCPVLESLAFYIHERNNEEEYRFNIPTLKHLKLKVWKSRPRIGVNKIVLNVPNLEDLFVGGWWRSLFVMEDFPSLVSVTFSDFWLRYGNLWVEFFKGIIEAKSLSYMPYSDLPNAPLPRFQNLKYLEFKSGYDFKLIFEFLESCSELEHLSIEEVRNVSKEVLKTLTITCKDERLEEEMRLCAKLLKCPRASSMPAAMGVEIDCIKRNFDSLEW